MIGNWIKSDDEYAVALTYGEKRIGEFNREDMTKLVEVMAQWRILLGVTSDSTEQELIIICQFVYDNFKKYTLSDIRLAMNWTISGKLDVGFVSQKNISSYYVSRALNAYEEEKRRIYNQFMYERDKQLSKSQHQVPEPSPEERANSFKSLIVGMYESYKNDAFFYDFGDFVYNWLKKTNQLNTKKSVIDAAIQYGRDKYLEERRKENINNIATALESDSKEHRQKKLARHYMIMNYFESTSLSEIVQSIKSEQFIQTKK